MAAGFCSFKGMLQCQIMTFRCGLPMLRWSDGAWESLTNPLENDRAASGLGKIKRRGGVEGGGASWPWAK